MHVSPFSPTFAPHLSSRCRPNMWVRDQRGFVIDDRTEPSPNILTSPTMTSNQKQNIFSTETLDGVIPENETLTFVKVPFKVSPGTTSIQVVLTFSEDAALDLGVLGPPQQDQDEEFRGWSGGARTEFFLATDEATPGYVPGAIHPGQWQVLLGPYRSTREGIKWKLQISLGNEQRCLFKPTPAPSKNLKRLSPGWFRGDLHLHTVYSDGGYTPSEVIQNAKQRKLDYFFSTEHNTPSANLIWGRYCLEDDDQVLVCRGEEVTTRKGHWNALGLDSNQWVEFRYNTDDDLKKHVEQVRNSDGIAIINHPFDEGKCCDWQFSYLDEFDAIEVWNGKWKRDPECQRNIKAVSKWQELLEQGKKFTAVGASDAHREGDVVGLPQTVVYANNLSTSAIIQALRSGNNFVASNPNYHINLELCQGEHNTVGMGGTIVIEGIWDLSARVSVEGFEDEPTPIIHLISQKGIIEKEEVTSDDVKTTFALDPLHVDWVRMEIRCSKSNHMLALSNPIWVTHSANNHD